ncbi:unnamed protein product [Rotaria sordida]|uniref:Mitochondria-eating protein n=1 Tax=Rotaria sordida TaxID=392033 RepID=A0A815R2P3_9BILA|nr:unnamed protein product [Rotaria sordida]
MSNTVNFHFIYAQHSPHTINNHIRKQQSTSKLLNTCFSTAAQYLNRTKSFHVPSNTTIKNNKNFISTNQNFQQQDLLTNNLDLARSVPSDINILNLSSTNHNFSITPIIHSEHEFQPISSEINLNENNKTQGIVYTLRRSLKKNKERFYPKRSTTMKSCNSLSNYEQSTNIQSEISTTPVVLFRHKYLEDNIDTCATITMKNHNSTILIDNNGNHELENNDQISPLQPLGLNGRNRILTKSPISPPSSSSSPIVQHQQQVVNLPPSTSLQSLTPITSNITDSNRIENIQQQITNYDYDEKERLKNDLIQLKNELQKSKETIVRLQKSEEQMRERLAEQAQRQLEKGGKFEDLNQISRPTELIRSYSSLYSQARIDALDALDNIREMSEADDLKSKLLFSVVVLAFRHAQTQAKDIRNKIKQILQLSNDKSSIVLEETIEKYLRTTIQKYDVGKITSEVENQLWTTLYDYPKLKSCNELLKYIYSACRTAWGLVNQSPPYYIEFQTIKYDKQIHERFHTSDNESDAIIEYVWPCLIDGRDRSCVAKGVVITDEQYLSIPKNQSS